MIDLTPAVHTWQIRLYNQVEQGRTAVDGLITGIWGRVVAAMLAPSPDRARILAYHALVELRTVPQLLRSRLTAVADAAADHTTRTLIAAGGVITEAAKPFRKPTKARAAELVHNTGWEARMNQLTRLADPRQLAEAIAQGVAAGEAPAKLAKRIRPLVGNVASAARRVARTEAIRVAHEIELEGYEQLGDMVVGYQVHALLDQWTRPEHRARDEQQYFRNPVGAELGMDRMPRPPLEADGTVAHNPGRRDAGPAPRGRAVKVRPSRRPETRGPGEFLSKPCPSRIMTPQ